jgi:DNA polymerase-3 subunit gamma/tau
MAKRKKAAEPAEAGPNPDSAPKHAGEEYTVLARRYRPQQFTDIVGQEPIARALVNALEAHRVAHAYLFTGARGVGKTSTARILAKALNCSQGPTTRPCDACEICQSIAGGEDVDVLEIDGASNRGIDEVRQIRQNVQYRPARARYKIYIIDEVHMLTPPAFNALLKTLEEPPAHVKFIFATTEVQRIPVTILSRCQRFDFAGIGAGQIKDQLRQIVSREKIEAEDEALELIARRAGGSMRDAESLLDQLLAFGGGAGAAPLTVDQVHHLLGTARADRVVALAAAVFERDAPKALRLLSDAYERGIQLGELIDQLIEYWRDLLVVHLAGAEARDLSVPARYREALTAQANGLSADSILAGLDILSATKARLRGSSHTRILLEMALVRLTRLDDLVSLSQLAEQLASSSGGAAPLPRVTRSANRQTTSRVTSAPTSQGTERRVQSDRTESPAVQPGSEVPVPLTDATLDRLWREILQQVGPMLAGSLEKAAPPAILGPKTLVLRFAAGYNRHREHCQEPARVERIEEALRKLTGQVWNLRIETVGNDAVSPSVPAAKAEKQLSRYRRQRAEALQEPLVKRASEVLGAQIVQMDDDFGAGREEPGASSGEEAEEP